MVVTVYALADLPQLLTFFFKKAKSCGKPNTKSLVFEELFTCFL
jgi:hypothetical protein